MPARHLPAVLTGLLALGLPAAPALAAAPVTIPIDVTFFATFTSADCGFPVYIHDRRTIRIISTDRHGTAVEIDVYGGGTTTFFSPKEEGGTGGSFTDRGTGHVDRLIFPLGTDVGDPAVVTTTGLVGRDAGVGTSTTAGRTVTAGTVVFVTPEGIPIVEPTGEVLRDRVGHQGAEDTHVERCEALVAPTD